MSHFSKYFTIDENQQAWGLSVIACGHASFEKSQTYPDNRKHPSAYHFNWATGRVLEGYYLVYITKGTGFFDYGSNGVQPIQAGQLFWLYPQVWHRYKPDLEVGWEEYWVGFTGHYAHTLMEGKFFDRALPVQSVGFEPQLLKAFQELFDVATQAKMGYPFVLSGILLKIIGLCFADKINEDLNRQDPTNRAIIRARFILQEKAQRALRMEDVAQELGVGYAWFRKQFKQSTGVSPAKYHQTLRLTRARELLTETTFSMEEIARELDFENVYHFSKLFKQQMGVAPSLWRNRKEPKSRI
jgi:AraC-like DNA-binding protein